jgi:hypothetical protein
MTREHEDQGVARRARWSWAATLVWLAAAGAALLTYANSTPWAEMQVKQAQPAEGTPGMTWSPLTRIPIQARDGIFALLIPTVGVGHNWVGYLGLLWKVALPTGIVLALVMAFWRWSRLAAIVYFSWLALVTLCAAAIGYGLFGRPPQSLCAINCDYMVIFAVRPAVGFWLTLAALALLWVSAGARLVSWRVASMAARRPVSPGALGALRSPARIAALVYTLGAVVWFFGFIFVPYATQGCTGLPINWAHFVSGSCAGLDANDALGAAWAVGAVSARSYILLGALTGLGMLVALIAVWQRGWLPPVFATIWAALATWLMALALNGLPALLDNPPRVSISTAPWVVGAGPAVTETGAVIVWVGAACVIWGYIIGRGPQSGRPNRTGEWR